MKKKLSILLVFSMMLMTMLMSGCGEQTAEEPQPAPAEPLVINVAALKGPTVISMIKMFEEQPNLGENVTVNYSVAEAPNIVMSRLLSGEVDIATVPTNLAAKLYNKGMPYQIAAVNVWGVLYILSNGVEINSWSDLKGRQIDLMGKGATPDIVLRHLLSQNGIDPDQDVTLEYTAGHVELAQKMIAGKVDLAVIPQPFATMVMKKNSDIKQVLDFQEEWKRVHGPEVPFTQAGLVVNKDLAENHPAVVARFLEEYEQSINWVNANPAEAGVLLEKHQTGMKGKLAKLAIPYCNIRFMHAMDARPALEKYFTVFKDFAPESIGGQLPDEGFYLKK